MNSRNDSHGGSKRMLVEKLELTFPMAFLTMMLVTFTAVILLTLLPAPLAISAEKNIHPQRKHSNDIESQKWRVLIVAESDSLGLRAGHPAYKRVNNAIFTQLQRAGFDVLSLAADVNFPACFMSVCEKVVEQDIVEVAKKSASNIDLVILFSIRYTEQLGASVVHREISVPSRMIDVQNGRRVGLWDSDGIKTQPIPEDCVDECLQQNLSDYARQVGLDSGLAIAIKLQEYQRWFDYYLTFEQFARGELLDVEQAIREQEGNNTIRALSEGVEKSHDVARRVLLHHVVDKSVVIESTLPPLDFRLLVEKALDQENVSAKIRVVGHDFDLIRDGFPYLLRYVVALLLLVITLLMLAGRFYGRYVAKKRKSWVRQFDVLTQALKSRSCDNPYEILMNAQRLLDKSSSATDVQQQRTDLLNDLSQFVDGLPVPTGPTFLKSGARTQQRIVKLLIDDRIAVCRKSEGMNEGEVDRSISVGFKRLSHLGKQNLIERKNNGFSLCDEGSANGSWADNLALVAGKSIALTQPNHLLCLGGSREPSAPGVCHMVIRRPESSLGSLVINVDTSAAELADKTYVHQNWPTLAFDKMQQWVLLGEKLCIGIVGNNGNRGELDIGCLSGTQPLMMLSYRDERYWVEPMTVPSGGGASQKCNLKVNGIDIISSVPLIIDATISLNGTKFSLSNRNL